jgi:hypothetical protein
VDARIAVRDFASGVPYSSAFAGVDPRIAARGFMDHASANRIHVEPRIAMRESVDLASADRVPCSRAFAARDFVHRVLVTHLNPPLAQ